MSKYRWAVLLFAEAFGIYHLVLCHKHGVLDRRKKLAAEIEKVGVLFESKKIKDAQLTGFITSYLKRKSIEIEPKASEMMAEFVGTDLSRMAGELENLLLLFLKGKNESHRSK